MLLPHDICSFFWSSHLDILCLSDVVRAQDVEGPTEWYLPLDVVVHEVRVSDVHEVEQTLQQLCSCAAASAHAS